MSKKVSKEELYQKYIIENKSITECYTFFNVSKTTILNRLKKYNIKKTDDQIKEVRERVNNNIDYSQRSIKMKNTLLETYGVDNPMKIPDAKRKAQETNIKKYGYNNPNKNKEVLKKRAETNLQKYGHECSLGNSEVQLKARMKCLEKYGDIFPLRSELKKELLEKRKQTNLEKYGSEEITTTEYFRKKVQNKCREKFGTDSPNESVYSKTIFASIENFKEYINKFEKKPTISEICMDLIVSDTYVTNKIHKISAEEFVNFKPRVSQDELEIIDFLVNELGLNMDDIIRQDRTVLNGSELDIYLPNYKFAIEYNGTYWHSNLYKDTLYHQNKTIDCEKSGVHLMHIFEYEWKDPNTREKIKNIIKNKFLKNSNRIYARKCQIRTVSKKEEKEFLNMYHLQNFRGSSVAYGLYYNDRLVQIMTFGKHKNYQWEVIREVSCFDTTVIGGTSRLLKHFIKTMKPENILSYCDYNKFQGNSYISSGMIYNGITTPDLKWIIDGKVYNRNPSKHSEMKNRSDAKIFGAGSKRYTLK